MFFRRALLQIGLLLAVVCTLTACANNSEEPPFAVPSRTPHPSITTTKPIPSPTSSVPPPVTSTAQLTDTNVWPAYHDETFSLSFQYPPEWKPSVAFNNYPLLKGIIKRIEVKHLSQPAGHNAMLIIDIRSKHGDLLQWFKEELPTGSLYLNLPSVEGWPVNFRDYNAQLAGYPAIFVYDREHNSGTPDMAEVHVADDQYFYQFTYWGDVPDDLANRAIYLRMLETVSLAYSTAPGLSLPETAFIKQTQSDATITAPVSSCPLPESLKVPRTSHFDPIDGKGTIAYSNDGLQVVFPTSLLTKTVHSLSALNLNGVDQDFAWSPDATQIAFLYTDPRPDPCGYGYLMVADLAKGEVRPLTQQIARYGQPVWSPDGQRLALTDDAGQLEIVYIHAGTLTLLSQRAATKSTPAWSDAEHVVYAERAKSNNLTDLVSQALDGSATQTLLSDIRINEFALFPDGLQAAYYGDALYLADLKSNSVKNIGLNPSERLQWSPDGEYLLGRGGMAGIYLVQPQASTPVQQIDFLGVPALAQSWSADGRYFAALIGPEDKLPTIGVYDISSHALKDLLIVVQPPYALAWSTRD